MVLTSNVCPLFRASLSLLLSVCLMLSGTSIAAGAQTAGGMRVSVIQGEGLALVMGSSSAKDVVVEVVDSSGKPMSNVNVSFVLGTGGTTFDGLSSLVLISDSQGRATARIRPTGQAGAWSIRITASYQQQQASTTASLSNVSEAPKAAAAPASSAEPVQAAPASSRATPPPPAKKSNKTLLIVLLIAAGAGGGAAAALGGKGSSSNPQPTNPTVPGISIGVASSGTGGFGTPGVH